MNENLTIQGALAETTVPDLFRSLIRSGETGILSLEAIGRHDTVFFDKGAIVNAATSDPDLGLAEILFRGGAMSLAQYQEASNRVTANRGIGAVLCDLEILRPDELVGAEEKQVRGIVKDVLSYRTGSYVIEFASEIRKEVIALKLGTERLVMDGVQAIPYWSIINRGLARMSRLLRHTPGSDAVAYHLEMSEEEAHCYSLLSEPQTIESVCGRSYLSNFATCRTLLALLTANLFEDGEADKLDVERATIEKELELEAIVELYNSTYQSLFALVFQEIGDYSWDFVDRVIGNISQERRAYLDGINLTNEGRVDFDQLLNNLISADTGDRRTAVKGLLNELVEGWVKEIRSEFGDRLKSSVDQIVEAVPRM